MWYLTTRNSKRTDTERGAVAVMVALSMVALVAAVAMVLDFGAVRVDRQMNKAASDSATTAGVRGLDRGDGRPHPFSGVCQALVYLKLSQPELSGLPDSSNVLTANTDCPATPAQLRLPCRPGDSSTHAHYQSTFGNFEVTIKSPFLVTDGTFPEEDLDTFNADKGDPTLNGCDQLGIIVTEKKKPGLGSIATAADLTSSVRSVGRVSLGTKSLGAVALLLLDRMECDVLRNASANTSIVVAGNGKMPGMIHSDSLGRYFCSSTKIFSSQPDFGIIAEESVEDPKLPGVISSRALSSDPEADATKAQGLYPKVVAKPDPGGATAGGLLTRSVIDDKYLSGIENTRLQANTLLNSTTAPAGFTETDCSPDATEAAAVKLWVNCANFNGAANFPNATEVIFKGRFSGTLNLPAATGVYIEGASGAPGINTSSFRMHHGGAGTCTTLNNPSRAKLVLRQGKFTTTGDSSIVQLCNTAVVLLGDPTGTGCLPTVAEQDYTLNACNGVLDITTGTLRWTAPDAVGNVERTEDDYKALEDLALWTEASGASHKLSANLYLSGVFMLPNAKPFNITGTGIMEVENSQYIVDKLDLSGQGTLRMKPDPYDSITVPIIGGFGLVR